MSNLMTIEEMRKHEWVVSWSGGKDSTATIILMREHKIPIKKIVYIRMMYDNELPATLPIMTDFVDQAMDVFKSWGYDVEAVKSVESAWESANKTYKRSKYPERIGKPYGITCFCRGRCKLTNAKQRTIKKTSDSNDYQMIGYAADEIARHKNLGDKKQSIMLALGVNEKDTFDICRKYNLLSPLYDLGIKRDGCFFCPNAAKRERAVA